MTNEEISRMLNQSWNDYSGLEVRQFVQQALKTSVGDLYRTPDKQADGLHHVWAFRDKGSREQYLLDPDQNGALRLADIALPDSTPSTVSYVVALLRDGTGPIVSTEGTVKIGLRFTSQEYNPITQTTRDTGEQGTLSIYTRLNDTASWTLRDTISGYNSMAADSGSYRELDLTPYLSTGTQQVRISVRGDETDVQSATAAFNVTKTNLALTFASNWERGITDGVMPLLYYIGGAVSKTLHILIDGKRRIERPLGAAVYTEAPLQINVSDTPADAAKVMTHGVHTIEAWLTVDDTEIETAHLHSQMMVAANPNATAPMVAVNSLLTTLTNWTHQTMMQYAVWTPDGEPIPVHVALGASDGSGDYLSLDMGDAQPSTRYSVANTLEIDSDEPLLSAFMRLTSNGTNLCAPIEIAIDNRDNFAATPGATFAINPRQRTNSEANPATIINAVDGKVIPSTWEGFSFINDGWVTDDNGQRCLRIPKGASITIDRETFAQFIGTDKKESLTVELDFRTYHATDTGTPVVCICSYLDTAKDTGPLGFEMRPREAVMLTQNCREWDDQNILFQEDEREHLALSIIHGANGTDSNFIRLAVNGVGNRTFAWDTNDSFVQYVDGKLSSGGIRLGSPTCNIDIYGFRHIPKALAYRDLETDARAALPTLEAKRAWRERNDITDDDGRISYQKAKEAYNTLVVKGVIPSYKTGKGKRNAEIKWTVVGNKKLSQPDFIVVKIDGQGTSSMYYWKWNFKFKDIYMLFGGLNVVAKLNWASSCQSHKMGACEMYNELHRAFCGATPVQEAYPESRVAVKQYPFMVFQQDDENSEPVFVGLYTIGTGKGDEDTFGVDPEKFPDQAGIEGSDNGVPLVNFWVPWNEDVQVADDDGDTIVTYNGVKNYELDFGQFTDANLKLLRDFHNFVFGHTSRIEPYSGSLDALQADSSADKTKQYWMTGSGSGYSRYELFYYSHTAGRWASTGTMMTQQTGITPTGTNYSAQNEQFRAWRISDFKAHVTDYFNINELMFEPAFKLMVCAIDNWAKNEYFEVYNRQKLYLGFTQDDLDSIVRNNNVGRLKNR